MKALLCYHGPKIRCLLLTILSGFLSFAVKAQIEPVFTQYMYNETFINPAYVGSHDDISATLLYRKQWVGIDGAPETQTFSIHAPIDDRRLGVGFSVINETIGVSHEQGFYGSFAYRILYPHSALAFGVTGGFVNDEELYTQLQIITQGDHQFTNDVTKMFMPNAGFGMYYYSDRFYAGLSIPRLLENNIVPSEVGYVVTNMGDLKIWHYYLTSGYVLDLNDELKLEPTIMAQVVENAPVQLDVDANLLFSEFLWVGAGYRTGDAVSALIGLQLSKQLRIGFSYDYTLTDLQKYNTGTYEFTLRYDVNYHKNSINSTRYF
jgi:type IX secretion system PorP/SprF family membrane protein